jgi:outer membrane immunogenic protein
MRALLTLLIALLPATAFAELDLQVGPWDSFYIGAQAGYSRYTVGDETPGGLTIYEHVGGPGGSVFLGGGWAEDWVYGSVEFEAGYDGANGKLFDSTFSADESFGLSLRAGGIIDDKVLIYLRLGWQNTAFRAPDLPDIVETPRLHAFRIGAGIEWAITEYLHLRAEYTHTRYEDDLTKQHRPRLGLAYYFWP